MKKLPFLKNAALLTLTGILLRALGMLLRIYISARIGEEGMGLYQLISSVYFLFITFAQSGVSVIVTRLCSSRLALGDSLGAYRVLKSGIVIALCLGSASAAALFLLSPIVCRLWIGDMRCVLSLRVLSVSLPFIALCNVFSAYFISLKNVKNGCIAQILEQLVRMVGVSLGAAFLSNRGLAIMLAAVFAANPLSEAVSCAFLGISVCRSKHPYSKTYVSGTKRYIIKEAAPVAASKYLASALHTAENMLVPNAATLYTHSRSAALSAFGALKGMAIPLIFFPSSFLTALSTLLVPEITEAYTRKDNNKLASIVKRVCFITLTLSIMLSGVFFIYHKNLGMLIYKSEQVSQMLLWLAPIVPFMYLDSICDGLLKGLGLQRRVFYHNCIDSVSRLVLVCIVVPRFGISGFVAVMALSNMLVSTLNVSLLLKTAKVKCDFLGWILKPLIAVFISSIITNFLAPNGATLPKTIVGSALFCAVFLLLTAIFSGFKKVY